MSSPSSLNCWRPDTDRPFSSSSSEEEVEVLITVASVGVCACVVLQDRSTEDKTASTRLLNMTGVPVWTGCESCCSTTPNPPETHTPKQNHTQPIQQLLVPKVCLPSHCTAKPVNKSLHRSRNVWSLELWLRAALFSCFESAAHLTFKPKASKRYQRWWHHRKWCNKTLSLKCRPRDERARTAASVIAGVRW